MERDVLILCEDIFGLEVYSILNEINEYCKREVIENDTYKILGFLSLSKEPFGNVKIDIPVITDIDNWNNDEGVYLVMGLKKPYKKETYSRMLSDKGAHFLTVLTPWTIVPDNINIGEGCVISNYSFKEGSVFGKYVTMINVMSEGSTVGDYTTIDALSNITNANIGKNVEIGTHSFIMVDTKVGDNACIFPGSIVFGNVKEGAKLAGLPANKAKYRKITEEEM